MFNKIYDKAKQFIKENYKFLLVIISLVFLFTFELPYVVYTPGGIVPLEKRIEVENKYDSKGSLNMSYVNFRKGTIPVVALSFIIPDWDLEKSSEVTGDDKSVDDLLKMEKLYMTSSIDNATIVAYQNASKKIDITKEVHNIIYISEEANTDIKLYDELISVDDKKISNIDELKEYINTLNENDKVNILVKRGKKEVNCYAYVYKIEDTLKIGVAFLNTYEYKTNPEISVKTKSSESGSSGGLMLSLAIYNSITEEDITHGLKVVGTGTIDIDGKVGAIDGVKYKMLGAKKNKADIFLCPKENYDEAIKVKKKYNINMNVVSINTFNDALNYLQNYVK